MGHTCCSKANKPLVTTGHRAWPSLATISDIFLVSLDSSCQYLFDNIKVVIMLYCAYKGSYFFFISFFLSLSPLLLEIYANSF